MARGAFAGLLGVGLITNGLAAFNFERYWNAHPLIEIWEQKTPQALPGWLRESYHQPMPWEHSAKRRHSHPSTFSDSRTSIAAFLPFTAITLPPGCVAAPQRKSPGIGVRDSRRRSHI
ncbi:hypothetical protein BH23PLA1_BH23PLA1_32500 [soil metagenome]